MDVRCDMVCLINGKCPRAPPPSFVPLFLHLSSGFSRDARLFHTSNTMVAAKLSVLMLLSVDSAACLVVGNSLMRRISQRNAHSPVMAVSVLPL